MLAADPERGGDTVAFDTWEQLVERIAPLKLRVGLFQSWRRTIPDVITLGTHARERFPHSAFQFDRVFCTAAGTVAVRVIWNTGGSKHHG